MVSSMETMPRKPFAQSPILLPTTEPKQRNTSYLLPSALKRKVQGKKKNCSQRNYLCTSTYYVSHFIYIKMKVWLS